MHINYARKFNATINDKPVVITVTKRPSGAYRTVVSDKTHRKLADITSMMIEVSTRGAIASAERYINAGCPKSKRRRNPATRRYPVWRQCPHAENDGRSVMERRIY